MRTTLQTLRSKQLFAKLSKYEFWLDQINFLGRIILEKGVYIDPKKVEPVVKWKQLTNTIEVRSFLGLAGYYHRFVQYFSIIAAH